MDGLDWTLSLQCLQGVDAESRDVENMTERVGGLDRQTPGSMTESAAKSPVEFPPQYFDSPVFTLWTL